MLTAIKFFGKNWGKIGVLVLAMSAAAFAAFPGTQYNGTINGAVKILSGGTINDVNASPSTVPIVNGSGNYVYVTPSPIASNSCVSVTAGANPLSQIFGLGAPQLTVPCGGTGTAAPSPVASTCISITGTWPGQTTTYTCPTPYPTPTVAPIAFTMVFPLPQVTPAVGTTSVPIYMNPNWKNLQFTGSHCQYANAGSGGSPLAWNFIEASGASKNGTPFTAAPIPTVSWASNSALAGGATASPTPVPTDTTPSNPNTWIWVYLSVVPTTAPYGNGSCTLEGTHQ